MNKQREVLRQIGKTNMSNRMIGRTLEMSHNTVKRYRNILLHKGLKWDAIEKMDDTQIELILKSKRHRINYKFMPDWAQVHHELQDPHVTLQLLWEEYCLVNPGHAYSYSQYTYYYRDYVSKIDLTMRQHHRAGENVFVDFAGRTVPYIDRESGEQHKAQIFIAVMGCSNYTFVYAVPSQSTVDWIEAHNQMFTFFGGIPQIVVPDNLKAAVISTGKRFKLNRIYLEMARHYNIIIVPARVRRPQDKSKAEGGVLLAWRWILVKFRHRQFFSIEEINSAITDLLHKLNERKFKKLPGCRRSRFEELDKPLLNMHPGSFFEYADWVSLRKITADYHFPVDEHYYSVPYQLVGERVEARVTKKTVELYSQSRRIASHVRSYVVGGCTTLSEHQPKSHREYAKQTPDRYIAWAERIGESSKAAVQYQFESRPHQVFGLKACYRLQRLAKDYGSEHFESACKRAELIGSLTVKSIRSILRRGLTHPNEDMVPLQINLPLHDNLRGSGYYSERGQ